MESHIAWRGWRPANLDPSDWTLTHRRVGMRGILAFTLLHVTSGLELGPYGYAEQSKALKSQHFPEHVVLPRK